MKETMAGTVFISIWIIIMLFVSKETPDISRYERNQVLKNPCDFMSSGQYSVNC